MGGKPGLGEEFGQAVVEEIAFPAQTRSAGGSSAACAFHSLSHFVQRGAGEEYFVHASPLHESRVSRGDGAAAPTEHSDMRRSMLPQSVENFSEELDVAAVIGGQTDAAHVFLNCG